MSDVLATSGPPPSLEVARETLAASEAILEGASATAAECAAELTRCTDVVQQAVDAVSVAERAGDASVLVEAARQHAQNAGLAMTEAREQLLIAQQSLAWAREGRARGARDVELAEARALEQTRRATN